MKTIKKIFTVDNLLSLSCGLSIGLFGLFFMTGNPYCLLGLVTFAVAFYFIVKD